MKSLLRIIATLFVASVYSLSQVQIVSAATMPIKAACPVWENAEYDGGSFPYVNTPLNESCPSGFTEIDYGVNDPSAAQRSRIIQTLKTRWPSGVKKVHIRYNHEINGDWYAWSKKTPAQFKSDFATFKKTIRTGVGSTVASKIDFVIGLNYSSHAHPVTQKYYTPNDWYTSDADQVAISFYDHRVESTNKSYAEDWVGYNTNITKNGHAFGPQWWLTWAKSKGKKLSFGEWGAKSDIYLGRMNDFIRDNRAAMGYHAYLSTPKAAAYEHRWMAYKPNVSFRETLRSGWTNLSTCGSKTIYAKQRGYKITSSPLGGPSQIRLGQVSTSTKGRGTIASVDWSVWDKPGGKRLYSGTITPTKKSASGTWTLTEAKSRFTKNTGSVRVNVTVHTTKSGDCSSWFDLR